MYISLITFGIEKKHFIVVNFGSNEWWVLSFNKNMELISKNKDFRKEMCPFNGDINFSSIGSCILKKYCNTVILTVEGVGMCDVFSVFLIRIPVGIFLYLCLNTWRQILTNYMFVERIIQIIQAYLHQRDINESYACNNIT